MSWHPIFCMPPSVAAVSIQLSSIRKRGLREVADNIYCPRYLYLGNITWTQYPTEVSDTSVSAKHSSIKSLTTTQTVAGFA